MHISLVKLGDIADIRGGKRVPLGHSFAIEETSHPYIRARDIRNGSIDITEPVYLSDETFEFVKNYTVNTGDVCLTIVGVIGAVGTVPEKLDGASLTENAVKLTNLVNADPIYVKYCLLSEPLQLAMQNAASGVAQPKLGIYKIKELKLPLPQLHVQRRIASILSTYDDLIENNNQRIALLEESMRLLYREWFVRLRFPGHEHVHVNDGLPEGWERKTLGDVIVLNYGKGLKEETRINGGIPVYGSSGIVGYHNEALVSGPAIIVGRKGNVGSVYWSAGDCFPIDTVYFITSEQATPFMYLNLKHQHFVSSDVAVPGLNRNHAYAQPILFPSQKLLNQFNEIIDTIIREIEILKTSSTKLSEARDLLLPRLMSGEIDVS